MVLTSEEKQLIDELTVKYFEMMKNMAYKMLLNNSTATEVVQETFIIACENIKKVTNHPKPEAWLFTTMKHVVRRYNEKLCESREIPIEKIEEMSDGTDVSENLPMEVYLPKNLKSEEHDMILMRHKYSMSYKDMVKARNISSVANARQKLSRAIRHCRELLEKKKINFFVTKHRLPGIYK